MNITSENIKTIRESHGWTQGQLAAKCNLLDWNLSRSTLAKIESMKSFLYGHLGYLKED